MMLFEGKTDEIAYTLRQFFHNLPHVNISFHHVNSSFDLQSGVYLESLGILSSIPAILLILTLIFLLLYLITQCCVGKGHSKCSIIAAQCALTFFVIMCLGSLAGGFYGNVFVHKGISGLSEQLAAINRKVSSLQQQTSMISNNIIQKLDPQLSLLEGELIDKLTNENTKEEISKIIETMHKNISFCKDNAVLVYKGIQKIDIGYAHSMIQYAETIRWPVTFGVLAIMVVFCIVLIIGLLKQSRGILITFSVLGLFGLVVGWASSCLYLAASVALSDFCVSPDLYFSYLLVNWMQPSTVLYYLQCPNTASPYLTVINNAGTQMGVLQDSLKQVEVHASSELSKEDAIHQNIDQLELVMNSTAKVLWSLIPEFHCHFVHHQFNQAEKNVCDVFMVGLVFMLCSSLALGLLFTLLVWIDSSFWIHGIHRKTMYSHVNHEDPGDNVKSNTMRRGNYDSLGSRSINVHTPPPYPGSLVNHHGSHGDHREEMDMRMTSSSVSMLSRPNNGEYPTLSKQCKTLESSMFY